jgi:hypothetical protein
MEQILVNLSNSQVQDILEELGMLEDGNCSYTAEEIFIAGMEYAINNGLSWLDKNIDFEHDYPSSKEELIENLLKAMKAEKVE